MLAIQLARVSDKKQDSNEAQANRMASYVERVGLTPWKIYEIEESSTRGTRKKFSKIVEDIKNSKETVALVVDTVDRLQRSFKDSVIMDDLRKEGKVELHFIRENLVIHQKSNSADILRWDMGVMFAKSYVLQLSDNVKRKQEENRRKGKWSSQAPLGYLNIKNEHGDKDIIPDPLKAHLIVELFEMYATGNHSISSLYNHAKKIGLTNHKGNPINRSVIDKILQNTFYIGIAPSKKHAPYPHRYATIIPRELFEQCENVRKSRKRQPSKIMANPFIFKGLLTCADCGCSYSPEIKKGKHVYYSCSNGKKICKRVYVNEKDLLEAVYEEFERFKEIPEQAIERLVDELRKTNEIEKEYHQKQITRIRAEYDKVQKMISGLFDMMSLKSITQEDYDKKLHEYKQKQHVLGIELEEHTNADHEYHIHIKTVYSIATRLDEIFKSSELEEKRAILNYLLQNPTVKRKKLYFSIASPFSELLELASSPDWLPG